MVRPFLAAVACLGLTACAAALREPPPLPSRRADAATGVGETERLLVEAEQSFATKEVSAVRRAARLWLDVASGADRRAEGLIGLTRARVWLADHEQDDATRLELAVDAVEAGQWCERVAPDLPQCTYQLAIALGLQARERPSTAHDALKIIVERLERVITTAPEIDHGGPHRVLALVLLRAPGWPAGPGDPETGLVHAVNAVNLDPNYPPNQLCLGEAQAAMESKSASLRSYSLAAELAREWIAAGEPDAVEWLEQAERALSDR